MTPQERAERIKHIGDVVGLETASVRYHTGKQGFPWTGEDDHVRRWFFLNVREGSPQTKRERLNGVISRMARSPWSDPWKRVLAAEHAMLTAAKELRGNVSDAERRNYCAQIAWLMLRHGMAEPDAPCGPMFPTERMMRIVEQPDAHPPEPPDDETEPG